MEQIHQLNPSALVTPIEVDLSDAADTACAFERALKELGGLDALVINASALSLDPTPTAKKIGLLCDLNVKSTLISIASCTDELIKSNGAIVTMAPPVRLDHPMLSQLSAYTTTKYAMAVATFGAASRGVRANTLWPRRLVRTAATKLIEDSNVVQDAYTKGRDADDVAIATVKLLQGMHSGKAFFDDEVTELPETDAPFDPFFVP